MAKAEQPEKSTHPTFRRRELTARDAGRLILCSGLVGTSLSVMVVSIATHNEYHNATSVVEEPNPSAETGPKMPNFDFKIPRRPTPGITYLLSTDPEARRQGVVSEGIQYAGYGTAPQDDLFLLDTGAKITRHGDDVEVLPLYGPAEPIHYTLDTLGRASASVALQGDVLTIGTTPTDVHKIIDYMAPNNVYPPPGMFRQQG